MPDEEWIKIPEDGRKVKIHLPGIAGRWGIYYCPACGSLSNIVVKGFAHPTPHLRADRTGDSGYGVRVTANPRAEPTLIMQLRARS
jgi:hypothetical protein